MHRKRGMAALALTPVPTLLLLPFRNHLSISSVLLLQLIAVALVATFAGWVFGVIAGLGALLLANWYFIPPYGTLNIADQDNLIALTTFSLVAFAIGFLIEKVRNANSSLERSTMERDIFESTAETRATLLAAIGHDLRTPLAAIKAETSGLIEGDVRWNDREVHEALKSIDESADRLQELVSNLLDISRLETGSLPVRISAADFNDILNSAIGLAPKLNIKRDIPTALPLIHTDEQLLERIVFNILTNIHNHTPANTLVEIVVGQVRGRIQIEIIDHGPGLSSEELALLFDRLPQGDRGGERRGLGLAIVARFARVIDVEVTARHTRGGGLTMRLTVPKANL
jgi:two-component system sensor histidine kinase KdpD